MEIAIDIYLKQDGEAGRILHDKVYESDIVELVRKRIDNGEINLPNGYSIENTLINIVIDKVTI